MNQLDMLILIILGFSGLVSVLRGFVKEALSLLIWFVAFAVAVAFGPRFAQLLAGWFAHETLRLVASFFVLFVGTLIVGGLVNQLIISLVSKAGLGPLDRMLGMVFGVLRGGIIVLVLLMIFPPLLSLDTQAWWQESLLVPKFLMLEDWALQTFSELAHWRAQVLSPGDGA
ncbi:MAG: CvpA family protein [Gammaproteobacteria bacterium]|nr:CvpA family protein [Gammaproteobacteria bacterium]NND38037.1 CvpA family protein [Pseudomonadales bacterium]MBT8151887.1 CvpA family protein [Gammaproteobacteria bacterium]NNL10490.1 CvpA family protein [Pseudomonadales bacterium]NNM10634.1 CvpA family protein [Pseudomonadales bacterium]